MSEYSSCKFNFEASWLTFGSGISINTQTGEVKIPEGLDISEAARQFWFALEGVRAWSK